MIKKNKNAGDKVYENNDHNINFPPVFPEEEKLKESEEPKDGLDIINEEDPFETPGFEKAEPGEGP